MPTSELLFHVFRTLSNHSNSKELKNGEREKKNERGRGRGRSRPPPSREPNRRTLGS